MTVSSEDFDRRTTPYRRELLAHCYRMLGSVHEAEDLVQETLLRAWRAFDRYDPERASLRTWLHRIATNVCLTALRTRRRRSLPSDVVGSNPDPDAPMVVGEVPWLQPFPDALLDPATVVAARGSLRLALVAAMQLLPPRQRAILILRDVLDWSAAEVAQTLATTPAAVNSGLQRARARLGALAVREEQVAEPADPDRRALVDRYVAAFERADVAALTRLLAEDAVLEMPPVLNWYVGRERYGRFMARVFAMRGSDWRILPTAANGQPALAAYVRDGDGYVPHTVQVLTVTGSRISRNVVFQDREVFAAFGLTPLPATASVT
ncbi:RNA polymerase, sigma subunit, ECF family [Micromonospora rhizosphaerae]|uniref:RNA polymerase sigma factor n=1 Tax=Micromonospora rhizosphaerae TaxID=568872 RepID=A0A1C6TC50_9ACTN|nr:sigma-70 family RNA polymerase sigma factor [Micromonospora rhizosphaerae]SCL39055.1 RNA polymerase, sigma subunit, ECF family [Micromonospora rhizosphaerae]